MNSKVDKYLAEGCMRCKLGGTANCKVMKWVDELVALRHIVLETGLTEEIKWGVPVYTHNGKNILSVNALKASANIGFFKGILLEDKNKILFRQGKLQSVRMIKFTSTTEIEKHKDILKQYIIEAISIEEGGKKVDFRKAPESVPEELIQIFENDSVFKKSFYDLTPGRQRGYIFYFSQPRQTQTRTGRIKKCREQILNGKGLNDNYGS